MAKNVVSGFFPSRPDSQKQFEIYPRLLFNETMGLASVFVPKCASSSLRAMLAPYRTVGEWEKIPYHQSEIDFDGLTVFVVVRNPITRFVSAYNEVVAYSTKDCESGQVSRTLPFFSILDPLKRVAQFIRDVAKVGLYDGHLLPQVFYHSAAPEINKWVLFECFNDQMLLLFRLSGVNPVPVIEIGHVSRNSVLDQKVRAIITERKELMDVLMSFYADDFHLHKRLSTRSDEELLL